MEIKVSSTHSSKQAAACLVLPIYEGTKQPATTAQMNEQSGKAISRAIKRGDATTKPGDTCLLHELNGIDTQRVLLVGAGKPTAKSNQMSDADYRKLCEKLAKDLHNGAFNTALLHTISSDVSSEHSVEWQAQVMAQALVNAAYVFDKHERQKPLPTSVLTKCIFVVDKKHQKAAEKGVNRGISIANGMSLAKDLGNLAPNICTPSYLAEQAGALAKKHRSLSTKVLSEAQMDKLNMQAFLSVSRGSRQPGKMICMEYKGATSKKNPIVIVGKGVTFDTGGISIKPSAGMDEMKYDMCGAASVFGAMRAICEMKLKCNVIGVVAAAENMPDGDASRPGDVVTTMSGQSVEILNTDAEGRLVLCDALTYVERFKPAAVIDIATLTGACVVALGNVRSGVMTNDQSLADALIKAGNESGDRTWQLPLDDEYQTQLDSNFADIANIGLGGGGAITAGCFLSRFAQNYKWAHLDIAGVAWNKGAAKGSSGRPVPLLVQYISQLSR